MMRQKKLVSLAISSCLAFFLIEVRLAGQDMLGKLGMPQDYISKRISSYDRTGGNKDSLTIEPGLTAVLAEIKGPGAIHHIWVTIAAEPFYGRKLVLRMFWDGEEAPSVEVPVGDFFGVGHGLNRNFSSMPITCSSEGRAKNCYWYMPFRQSARITVTNEGQQTVPAFYYYVDYRELKDLPADAPCFHAQYRQEMPCEPGRNYLILEASGRGHYVGCNLSILQRAMGWWGEGDDMIYVDGETFPSLHGTGSEDYFSDAWGMREAEHPFYGCPLQEEDFQAGSKATVYRFHVPDPIPFQKSIRVTIEHGHANDRSDYYSSTAYWYQAEPHMAFPALPSVAARLPYAMNTPENFILPKWEEKKGTVNSVFEDKEKGLQFTAEKLSRSLTSYYGPDGSRYPVLMTERAKSASTAELTIPAKIGERYNIDLYFLKGPGMGNLRAAVGEPGSSPQRFEPAVFEGFAKDKEIGKLTLKNVLLREGQNTVLIQVTGKAAAGQGMDLGFLGYGLNPASRQFITEWNLIGPFDAPDMDTLFSVYPPEKEIRLDKRYPGKDNVEAAWRKIQAEPNGYIRLTELVKPNEQVVVYAFGNIFSPESVQTHLLLGSDDGIRVWINDELVHSNPAYRGAYPDQDIVKVSLRKGWNKVLVKVLQGAGGWGYYVRFVDPDGKLKWSTEPQK
jgi:hypothetical protein